MVTEETAADDWRANVRRRLAALHDSITSSDLSSDVPLYVVETLTANIQCLMASPFDAESAHGFVRGAFRGIGDACSADDDDAIFKQLLAINELLPPDE